MFGGCFKKFGQEQLLFVRRPEQKKFDTFDSKKLSGLASWCNYQQNEEIVRTSD